MTIEQQLSVLSRRCERILSTEDLTKKLDRAQKTNTPLRIKFGMDPTAADVTLGHAVPLKIIRQFQDWGHKAVLIIGDYTARVGDPTGRNKTRPQLTGEEIDANAKTYVGQVGKILLTDAEHLEIRYNGEWLAKMNLIDIIRLASKKSVAQTLTREDFAKRYAEGVDIRLHEILYPLLQGWDSVMVNADVEMGGSDQLFNNMVGREFQQEENPGSPLAGQVVIVTPLLVGTDGVKKMSKSQKNYIAVTDPAGGDGGMFGKIMQVPDHLMEMYYSLLTDFSPEEYRPLISSHPRDAKVKLAKHLISWLHDSASADAAEKSFMTATHGGIPDEMPEITLDTPGPHKIAPLLVKAGMAKSNSEGMQLVKGGGVKIDGQKVVDPKVDYTFDKPVVLQVGSRKFVRLKW